MPGRRPLAVRFWEKVAVRGADDCWEWTASKDGLGYGWIGDGNKHMVRAPRVSFVLNIGPIPITQPRTLVLHHCDNPSCVNPAHLFLGTDMDNSIDMDSKGRRKAPRGIDCHSAVFTPEMVLEIRERLESGCTCKALSDEYNVTPAAIRKIKKNISWKWVK